MFPSNIKKGGKTINFVIFKKVKCHESYRNSKKQLFQAYKWTTVNNFPLYCCELRSFSPVCLPFVPVCVGATFSLQTTGSTSQGSYRHQLLQICTRQIFSIHFSEFSLFGHWTKSASRIFQRSQATGICD